MPLHFQYDLPISSLPDVCVCGNEFTCDHAMTCEAGGFISLRHNEIRDLTGKVLKEVCENMWAKPLLQPLTGKKLKYQTSVK